MKPVELRTPRLVLDQPTPGDRQLIYEYCQDPIFERFMTLPWPYRQTDADFFIDAFVPAGWATAREFTWALRAEGNFVGTIGLRSPSNLIGFWLGAPHRGNGFMPEALHAVADWSFSCGNEAVEWECIVGNVASAAVARKSGFTYLGEAPAEIPSRDGSRPAAWHGVLLADDTREPKAGWPA